MLTATLQTPFGEIGIRLRNLSRKGALVECEQPLPVGGMAVFRKGDVAVPAKIAWNDNGRAGLEFAYPIIENALTGQFRKNEFQHHVRPVDPEMAWDEEVQKLAREWGVKVGIDPEFPEE